MTRDELQAQARKEVRIIHRTYDTDHRAYQAAENRLAKINAKIAALDAAEENAR